MRSVPTFKIQVVPQMYQTFYEGSSLGLCTYHRSHTEPRAGLFCGVGCATKAQAITLFNRDGGKLPLSCRVGYVPSWHHLSYSTCVALIIASLLSFILSSPFIVAWVVGYAWLLLHFGLLTTLGVGELKCRVTNILEVNILEDMKFYWWQQVYVFQQQA